MIVKTCLLSLSFAPFIGTAVAQTQPWPIVNGRQSQPSQQQIESRKGDRARERDDRAQPAVDRLYDEILRATTRQRR